MSAKISNFAFNVNYLNMDNTKNINRLKAVLADVNQTNKWLAEQLGKDTVTVIKWCKIPHSQISDVVKDYRTLEC